MGANIISKEVTEIMYSEGFSAVRLPLGTSFQEVEDVVRRIHEFSSMKCVSPQGKEILRQFHCFRDSEDILPWLSSIPAGSFGIDSLEDFKYNERTGLFVFVAKDRELQKLMKEYYLKRENKENLLEDLSLLKSFLNIKAISVSSFVLSVFSEEGNFLGLV